jgi:hypothetical protein
VRSKSILQNDETLIRALDELYAAPFERFVSLRADLRARFRAAGDAAGARQVSEAAKPTRTAWALNRVARSNPELVAAMVRAREGAATAQKRGDSTAIRDLVRQYRDAVAAVVRAVRATLVANGGTLSATHARRVGETLQALAADEGERKKLTTGRLTRDVEVDDPFSETELGPLVPGSKRRPSTGEEAPSQRANEKAARAREAERLRDLRILREKQHALDKARSTVSELDDAIAEARKFAMQEDREARRAQYAADKANRKVADLMEKLARARDQLKKLQTE